MKGRLLNFLLILTSLFGYLEWGGNNSSFLFQVEGNLITSLITNPESVIHPFTLLPLVGQILLFITLFQKKPNKILTYLGIGGIGILLFFMFVIGVMGWNVKIILSTLPFLVVGFYTIRHHQRRVSK